MSNEVLSILTITVPIIAALISGIFSYVLAVKKANKEIESLAEQHKHDLDKIEKQHSQDMETLGEKHRQALDTLAETHKLEMEKIQRQHEHERHMKEQENSEKLSMEIIGSLMGSVLESDEYKKLLAKSFDKSAKKNRK